MVETNQRHYMKDHILKSLNLNSCPGAPKGAKKIKEYNLNLKILFLGKVKWWSLEIELNKTKMFSLLVNINWLKMVVIQTKELVHIDSVVSF